MRRFVQKLDDEDGYPDPLGVPVLWPGGRHVAVNGIGRTFVWELESGECTQVLRSGAICRDGHPSFHIGVDAELGRVLDAHAIRDFAVWDAKEWRRLQIFRNHSEEVYGATFVPDDRIISISGDSTAQLWDAWSGEHVRSIDTVPLYALARHPSGEHVAVAGSHGRVYLLDAHLTVRGSFALTPAKAKHEPLSDAQKRKIGIVWNRPDATIRALAWHPDGEHLLCGSWDFVPKLVHAKSGKVVRSWHGHGHWVDAVAVDAAGRWLVTGSSDGTVRVWSLGRSECQAVFELGSVGGVLVHEGNIYATTRDELLVIPLPTSL